MKRIINQQHPPGHKKKGQEAPLNPTYTVMKDDGATSTVIGYGAPVACDLFIESLIDNAKKLNIKIVGKYHILKHKKKI